MYVSYDVRRQLERLYPGCMAHTMSGGSSIDYILAVCFIGCQELAREVIYWLYGSYDVRRQLERLYPGCMFHRMSGVTSRGYILAVCFLRCQESARYVITSVVSDDY